MWRLSEVGRCFLLKQNRSDQVDTQLVKESMSGKVWAGIGAKGQPEGYGLAH